MKKRGDLNRKTTSTILEILVKSGEPLHVREIIRRSGLCNETVVRVLKTLAEKGWLECAQYKNKKCYYLKQNLPLPQKLKLFSLIKNNSAGEGGGEKAPSFEEWMTFCAALSSCFSAFLKTVDEIREAEKNQAEILKAIEKINKFYNSISEKINSAFSFYEKNKEKVEFLRKEFLSEDIDIFEMDVADVIKLVSWFKKYEDGYLELRMRGGLRPLEALEWAKEYKWLKIRKEMKTTPMGEWNSGVRRLFEHSLKTLRDEYGRLTFKKALGLND